MPFDAAVAPLGTYLTNIITEEQKHVCSRQSHYSPACSHEKLQA